MFKKCKYCHEYIFFNHICDNRKRFRNWKNRVGYNSKAVLNDSELTIRDERSTDLCFFTSLVDYNIDIELKIEEFAKLKDSYFELHILLNRKKIIKNVKITDYKNQYLHYRIFNESDNIVHKVFICDIISIKLLNNKIWIDTEGYKVVRVIDNKLFSLNSKNKKEFIIGIEYDVCKEYKDVKDKTSFYELDFYDSNCSTDDIPFRFFRCVEAACLEYKKISSEDSSLKLYRIKAEHCAQLGNSESNNWAAQKITFIEQVEI